MGRDDAPLRATTTAQLTGPKRFVYRGTGRGDEHVGLCGPRPSVPRRGGGNTVTGTRLRRPKPIDLRAALALIAASLRGDDEAVTTLWDAAAEEDGQLMLCLALATYAKQPTYMADLLGNSLATA